MELSSGCRSRGALPEAGHVAGGDVHAVVSGEGRGGEQVLCLEIPGDSGLRWKYELGVSRLWCVKGY